MNELRRVDADRSKMSNWTKSRPSRLSSRQIDDWLYRSHRPHCVTLPTVEGAATVERPHQRCLIGGWVGGGHDFDTH